MACPICARRAPRRFCPAKGEDICAVCCGTGREVAIDCPRDCPYLQASRKYDYERKEIDWSKMPFRDVKITEAFVSDQKRLIDTVAYAVCDFANAQRLLVDSDVMVALESLAETYRTLSGGIYYEKPPDFRIQRELYELMKTAIDGYKQAAAREAGVVALRDGDIRDALIFLVQLGFARSNGRPKGRAFLDLLRSQFKPEQLSRPASNLIVLP